MTQNMPGRVSHELLQWTRWPLVMVVERLHNMQDGRSKYTAAAHWQHSYQHRLALQLKHIEYGKNSALSFRSLRTSHFYTFYNMLATIVINLVTRPKFCRPTDDIGELSVWGDVGMLKTLPCWLITCWNIHTPQWIYQQWMMIEACFNVLNTPPEAKESLCVIRLHLDIKIRCFVA